VKRALLLLILFPVPVLAAPEDAVVKVPSHGGSAVVIQTGAGYTYLLSAAHLFEGKLRHKPITIDAPAPTAGQPAHVGVQVLAIDDGRDLSLMLLHAGPLPYVCPVPTAAEYRIFDDLISAGYDEMKPRTVRPALIVAVDDLWIYTQQKPWHGRSGGGLIDRRSNMLLGIVSRYEAMPGAAPGQVGNRGVYASRKSILAFLNQRAGAGASAPPANPHAARPRPSLQPFRRSLPPQFAAPGGC
jgi:hypothetical protein